MSGHSKLTLLTLSFFTVLLLSACGGGGYQKSALDQIIRDLPTDKEFSVILHDMDVKGSVFETYYHQYQIIQSSPDGEIDEDITDWQEVSEQEFNRYINDMGMEIAARDSTGKLTKNVAPPGYNNYVGNTRYGYWDHSGGSNFWVFYGQYAMLSSLFRMSMYPVSRGYYDDWHRNYRDRDERYYGPSSGGGGGYAGRYYGTGSSYSKTTNPTSSWNSRSQTFRDRVATRVSRSTGKSSSGSSGGSFRSKGGGFGK